MTVVYHAAPGRISKGLAKHPIPVMILARLAVDLAYQIIVDIQELKEDTN